MMGDVNIALLVVGFFLGYFLKGFFTFRGGWSATAIFVEKTTNQVLKLIGATVYKVAFIDQLYKKAIALTEGSEEAKLHRNELEYDFEEWKKETMEVFVENYPEEYRWQMEVNDWSSAMRALTEMYKDRRD
jgi:hypothetical protein